MNWRKLRDNWAVLTTVAAVLFTAGAVLNRLDRIEEVQQSQGDVLVAIRSALEIHIGKEVAHK